MVIGTFRLSCNVLNIVNVLENKFAWANVWASQKGIAFNVKDTSLATEFGPVTSIAMAGEWIVYMYVYVYCGVYHSFLFLLYLLPRRWGERLRCAVLYSSRCAEKFDCQLRYVSHRTSYPQPHHQRSKEIWKNLHLLYRILSSYFFTASLIPLHLLLLLPLLPLPITTTTYYFYHYYYHHHYYHYYYYYHHLLHDDYY